ncbi:hypothetical protein EDB19DRAFT_1911682 [Suillus lakei]|nr:hypothetical protein EDB19DRAFT_1911682 [Suillus lakei]
MKRTLCRKYKQAKNGIAKSGKAFNRLDAAAPADSKTKWLASERTTQSSRIHDPVAMDVYEINIKKAPSKKEIKLRLLEDVGLAIEEAQTALLIEGQIDGFTQSALTHLGERFDAEDDPDNLNIDILNDLDDDLDDFTEISNAWTNSPKLTVIPLPSNLRMLLREGQANNALHNL